MNKIQYLIVTSVFAALALVCVLYADKILWKIMCPVILFLIYGFIYEIDHALPLPNDFDERDLD